MTPLRRAALCGAALLVAVWVGPAATAGPLEAALPVLEVTGHGATTATFTLDAPATLRLDRAVVTGTGRYAGVAFVSAWGTYLGAVVSVPEMDGPDGPWPLGGPTLSLRAGRYRAYLLADSTADVRIPLQTGAPQSLTTTSPVRETFYAGHLDVPAGAATLTLSRAIASRPTTRTIVLGQYAGGVAVADVTVRACLVRRGRACGTPGVQVSAGAPASLGPPLRASLSARDAYLPAAPLDARAELVTAGSYAATFAFATIQFDRA